MVVGDQGDQRKKRGHKTSGAAGWGDFRMRSRRRGERVLLFLALPWTVDRKPSFGMEKLNQPAATCSFLGYTRVCGRGHRHRGRLYNED